MPGENTTFGGKNIKTSVHGPKKPNNEYKITISNLKAMKTLRLEHLPQSFLQFCLLEGTNFVFQQAFGLSLSLIV